MTNQLIPRWAQLRQWDKARPGLPGEHWFSFGLGLFLVSRRPSHALVRAVSVIAGTALLARSMSGRDGPVAAYVGSDAPLSPTDRQHDLRGLQDEIKR